MLEGARLDPKQEIGFVAHRAVSITAEKVAINAVMAGCKPEFMPVVVAAVEGIADPRWSYHGPGTSTAGAGVLMIVNGPIARELDVNAGDNLRSEEHTSELQSQSNLLSRILLDKQKTAVL